MYHYFSLGLVACVMGSDFSPSSLTAITCSLSLLLWFGGLPRHLFITRPDYGFIIKLSPWTVPLVSSLYILPHIYSEPYI